MKAKIIHNEQEYEKALSYVATLMDKAEPGSPEGDALDPWATLITVYEDDHHPIDLPDPIEAMKFRMEQQAL